MKPKLKKLVERLEREITAFKKRNYMKEGDALLVLDDVPTLLTIISKQAEALEKVRGGLMLANMPNAAGLIESAQEEIEKLCELE